MNLTLLLLGVPLFFLVYQGVGLLSEAKRSTAFLGSRHRNSQRRTFRELSGFGARFVFNRALLKNEKFRQRLDLLLIRSGHPFGWKAEDLLLIKELGACLALLCLWRAGVAQPLAWVVGPLLGFWLPSVYIKAKGTARQGDIQRQLPGFVDLLALTLESGLDLLSATERIVEKMKSTALAEELRLLIQENRLGTPRKEALEHLAFRVDTSDMSSLTSMIIQSEELGTSLALVLRNYADDMRNRRILRAEEVAGKAPVKLLFPMMIFFFPIVFIVIFGPLALNFFSSYK